MTNAKPRRRKSDNANPSVESALPRIDHTSRDVTGDEVALRAFALYCKRGGHHGHDVEDWLQAERELRTSAKPTAA